MVLMTRLFGLSGTLRRRAADGVRSARGSRQRALAILRQSFADAHAGTHIALNGGPWSCLCGRGSRRRGRRKRRRCGGDFVRGRWRRRTRGLVFGERRRGLHRCTAKAEFLGYAASEVAGAALNFVDDLVTEESRDGVHALARASTSLAGGCERTQDACVGMDIDAGETCI